MVALIGFCALQVFAMGDRNQEDIRLAKQTSLHQFEGYYRFPDRLSYIHFEVVDDNLQASLLWDGRVYALKRIDNVTFETKDGQYKVMFNDTSPTGVRVLDRWDLVKVDFNPTQRKKISNALVEKYKGDYTLKRDGEVFEIEVSTDGGKLALIQKWDGKRIQLDCITDHEFVNQEAGMPVSFYKGDEGAVVMYCFKDDPWKKVK